MYPEVAAFLQLSSSKQLTPRSATSVLSCNVCGVLCRLAMAELERALAGLAALQSSQAAAGSPAVGSQAALAAAQRLGAAASGEGDQKAASTLAAAEGMVLYKLYKVYREVQALYRLKDSSSKYSDWPHLSADLLSMVGPNEPPAAKLELHKRMLRTYCVLQP